MTEPSILWYWEEHMLDPGERDFFWAPVYASGEVFSVKCKARGTNANWNVCRVEFEPKTEAAYIQQTMDTLLDVCRMRYADKLINQGEKK